MTSLKEKITLGFQKLTATPVELSDLVGQEITILHDSGNWKESYIIGQDAHGRYLKFQRFVYENSSSGKEISGDNGIYVSSIDDVDSLKHIKDNLYLLSTPKCGGGYSLSKFGVRSFIAKRFPELIDQPNSEYAEADAYLKSLGH